jgi:hypothetical protein
MNLYLSFLPTSMYEPVQNSVRYRLGMHTALMVASQSINVNGPWLCLRVSVHISFSDLVVVFPLR